jgi:GNAT superfamily N-acetyltransferase
VDGRLVASCILVVVPNLTRGGRPFGVIENVVTHREYRRRGIGSELLHHALDLAWEAGCYKVMLLSGMHRVESHAFYESVGFQKGAKIGFEARPPDTR